MFFYKPKATTFKNINKFSYELYTDISINMLKYNNDSSTVIRILDALTASTRETLDDLPYSALFTATDISFRQIDRLHKFYIDSIMNLDIEQNDENVICNDTIIGYSKYTDTQYSMEYVDDKNDFIRHSLPCDCFVSKKTKIKQEPKLITLTPNIWVDINQYVESSAITIKPMGAMDSTTKDPSASYITVIVEGVDTRNEIVEEFVNIEYWCEFKTDTEFTYINRIKVLNSLISYDVILYPYINGKEDAWLGIITDREEFDRRNALIKFNPSTKKIEYSVIYKESISFPTPTDTVKTVEVGGMDNGETISDYYIDQPNGLFYTVTNSHKLYCYPLIIPKAVDNQLDDNKTLYQACRIEYIEDCVNEKFTFDIFPTSKANGVDALDIYLNNEIYLEGMIIDLFREKLIDNRIDIPFHELFKDGDDCLIEFKTYGTVDSSFSVYVIKPKVDPLYVKDLLTMTNNYQFEDSNFIFPDDRSTKIDYDNVTIGSDAATGAIIYKLSKYGNVIVNGYLITDVFKTFYYSEEDNSIITSDTITHISSGNSAEELGITENLFDEYRYQE